MADSSTFWQEYVDKNHPFIEQGAEPPGRYEADPRRPGLQVWKGKSGWRTRHGEAIVNWSLGQPSEVQGALYPDGTRGQVRHTLDHGFRRRATGPKLWVYGTIDLRPDDVVFIDGEQPAYVPPPVSDVPNLEADLARDLAFLKSLQDDWFARAVYAVFDNRTFLKGRDERPWVCGSRRAAHLVANLRGLGESYHDYFLSEFEGVWPDDRPERERSLRQQLDIVRQLHAALKLEPEESARQMQEAIAAGERGLAEIERDPNGDVFAELRAHLTRLGWRTATEGDRRNIHARAMQARLAILDELKGLDGRPETPAREWTSAIRDRRASAGRHRFGNRAYSVEGLSADEREVVRGGLIKRLDDLALSGRVSRDEYDGILARIKAAGAH